MQHPRIFGLDILRTIAILLVLLAHTIPAIGKTNIITTVSFFSGVIGVELFFVLSGFLIGTILIKMHNQDDVTNFHSIKIFWIRRWFRTLPNYYLALIGFAILFYLGTKEFIFSTSYGLSFIVFLQNFFTFEFTNYFFGVSWSLAVEEWFYLLFPLFLFFGQFIFSNKKKSFLFVTFSFILIPLITKIFLAQTNYDIPWDAGYRKIASIRLDAIGFGVLTAYIKYYYQNLFESKRSVFLIVGLFLFTVLIILFYNLQVLNYDFANEKQLYDPGFFMKTFFFTLISLSISLLIPFLSNVKVQNTNSYFYKIVNVISLSSYSIYLTHLFYIFIINYVYNKLNISIDVFWLFLVWVSSIIGSYFQYNLFEVRFTALRDRFGVKKDKISV